MGGMTRLLAMLSGLALALFVASAAAQQVFISPGGSQFHPLPPPPTPNVPVPVTPMFGPRPQQNYVPASPPSFSDRVVRCLQQGAAAGLGPNARAAYSSACANQQ
jgi:hypothetical protein